MSKSIDIDRRASKRAASDGGDLVRAKEAARLLDVKLETLYSYASRGLIRSVGRSRTEGHVYRREDLERLLQRKRARSGHAATAASALRWGEPVIDSAVSTIDSRGPIYRGLHAVDLVARGYGFEQLAELLWTGALPERAATFRPSRELFALAKTASRATGAAGRGLVPHGRMFLVLAAMASRTSNRALPSADPALELAQARGIIAALAASCGPSVARIDDSSRISSLTAESLGASRRAFNLRAIDTALSLLADHELNASTFTARVAASAGASLPAVMLAALGTLAGSKHGGASGEVELMLDHLAHGRDLAKTVAPLVEHGAQIPGFHHTLYPDGDPRFDPIMDAARTVSPRHKTIRIALDLARHVQRARGEHPNVDLALVVLADALRLPRGSAAILFAIGRTAGWIAHAMEQRSQGFLLRPRARYVGADTFRHASGTRRDNN